QCGGLHAKAAEQDGDIDAFSADLDQLLPSAIQFSRFEIIYPNHIVNGGVKRHCINHFSTSRRHSKTPLTKMCPDLCLIIRTSKKFPLFLLHITTGPAGTQRLCARLRPFLRNYLKPYHFSVS